MNRKSSGLKRIAREELSGHWGLAVAANLVAVLVVMAALAPFYFLLILSGGGMVQMVTYGIASLVLSMVMMVMQCGILRIHLCFARREEADIQMLFGEFTRKPERYVLLYLFLFGIGLLCMLPGMICLSVGAASGVVLAYGIGGVLYLAGLAVMLPFALRYSMAALLLVEDGQLSAWKALQESRSLMEGNRGRLFYIELSFIGWGFLGMLSSGIGMLWIVPYMSQTTVAFYRDLLYEPDDGSRDYGAPGDEDAYR